jgi:hypothetical protein
MGGLSPKAMAFHAPAQTIDDQAEAGVIEIRAAGKRGPTQKLDLSDPRVITKEVVVALARKVHPDAIADRIHELINAKRETKSGGSIPDVRAMEAGIKLYLAYVVGLPVQRTEAVNVNLDAASAAGLEDRLRKSPALRATFRRILDATEDGAPQDVVGGGAAGVIDDSKVDRNPVEHP